MGPITSFRDVFSAIRRQIWVIILILAVGLPASVWFALSQPRLYEATAVIQIEAPRVAETLAGSSGQTANNLLDLIQQQLMSRDNIAALIDQFDLYPTDLTMTEKVGLLRSSITLTKLIDPAQAYRPEVQPSGLSITVRLEQAQQAADVANAMLDKIVTEARARSEETANRTLDFLVAEETRIAAEIAVIESRIADYRQANVASLPEGLTAQRERLADLTESQLAIDNQILSLDSASDRLRPEEVARQTDLLHQQRALIGDSMALTEAAIAATPAVEQELSAMNRDLSQLETEYAVTTTRRTEAAMNQLLESQDQSARFEVLETAITPEFPVSASRRKLALAGGVVTVALALAAALAVEILNPAIRTAAQMERQLGVQPVIVVPYLRPMGKSRGPRIGLFAILGAAALAIWVAVRNGLFNFWPRTAG